MNESLPETHRTRNFSLKQLNPFTQLFQLLRMKNLNRLLFAGILLWLPNGALKQLLVNFH